MSRAVSIETLLDREVDALDQLVGDARGGIRGAAHFDMIEDKANGIADRLRAAFRERRKELR